MGVGGGGLTCFIRGSLSGGFGNSRIFRSGALQRDFVWGDFDGGILMVGFCPVGFSLGVLSGGFFVVIYTDCDN